MASGVVVEDLTEKEVLIEELIEREDTIKPDVNPRYIKTLNITGR